MSKYSSLCFISLLLITQENTETKRKSSKRTFKSETEFLEFTLRYQQVIAERDAGKLSFRLTITIFVMAGMNPDS